MLELGSHIVNQLKLHDSVDTLSRWMAHYLAELIEAAQNEEDEEKKSEHQKHAAQVTMQLWERKASLPRGVDPMEQYSECLSFIVQLLDQTPIVNVVFYGQKSEPTLIATVRRLIDNYRLSLQSLTVMHQSEREPKNAVALENLPEEEQQIVTIIEALVSDYEDREVDPVDASIEYLEQLKDSCTQLIEAISRDRKTEH